MSNPTITIHGVPIELVSPEEAEKATFVVCGTPEYSTMPDDVHTRCAACDKPIIHRPYAPKTPPKICIQCMMLLGSDITH